VFYLLQIHVNYVPTLLKSSLLPASEDRFLLQCSVVLQYVAAIEIPY